MPGKRKAFSAFSETVVVTGASAGIGRATVREFARQIPLQTAYCSAIDAIERCGALFFASKVPEKPSEPTRRTRAQL